MMEAQAGYIAQVARRIADGGARLIGVRRDVADAYDEEMQERLRDLRLVGCVSWYVDGPRITTNWPGLVAEYQARLGDGRLERARGTLDVRDCSWMSGKRRSSAPTSTPCAGWPRWPTVPVPPQASVDEVVARLGTELPDGPSDPA